MGLQAIYTDPRSFVGDITAIRRDANAVLVAHYQSGGRKSAVRAINRDAVLDAREIATKLSMLLGDPWTKPLFVLPISLASASHSQRAMERRMVRIYWEARKHHGMRRGKNWSAISITLPDDNNDFENFLVIVSMDKAAMTLLKMFSDSF